MIPGKDGIRRDLRARLRALTTEEREAGAKAVARRVWEVPEVAGARVLLLYASLPEEVPTDAVAHEAWRRGITVAYPRCVTDTRAMTLHALETLEELRAGSYGIREPDALACPLVTVEEIDAVLVPGLGWDRRGGRIGRGAGYYDRLFADPRWRGFRCGLFFSAQEVPELPVDPWDAPLDAVVTEREVWRLGELAPSPDPSPASSSPLPELGEGWREAPG
ncbi:MAG: 5-formyltetrahydrofolate cyclo-ligase [Gemmatimonadetes bacterium]|nr:5-formyltetrahydrofolate cyclo-ligase [Gemmatimonadota bacterium]